MNPPKFKFKNLPPSFRPDAPVPNNLQPPSYVPTDQGYQWKPTRTWSLSGEFTPVNDRTPTAKLGRWWLYQPRWGTSPSWPGRQPGFFKTANSTFERDALVLRARRDEPPPELLKKGYKDYSTSFVRSKDAFTYGYVEIACKLGDSTISSAFWLKEVPHWALPGRRMGTREREIDMFEYSSSSESKPWKKDSVLFSHIFHMNTHWFDSGVFRERRVDHVLERYEDTGVDLSKEKVIKVGILWSRERICWYLNDELAREERADGRGKFNTESHFERFVGKDAPKMHIQFDRETMYGFFGAPKDDDKMHTTDGDFKIFYCRTWEMEPTPKERASRGLQTRSVVTRMPPNAAKDSSAGEKTLKVRSFISHNNVIAKPQSPVKARSFGNGWSN